MRMRVLAALSFATNLLSSPTLAAPQALQACKRASAPHPLTEGRDALIRALKEQYQVEISKDNPKLFTEDFLLYLYSYFGSTKPSGKPFYLHASDTDSAQAVKATPHTGGAVGTDITFSLGAGRNLESGKLRETREILEKNPEILKNSNLIKIQISYSNDLFENLNRALLSQDHLKKILLEKYKIDVTPTAGSIEYDHFSSQELNTILKNLVDLPPELTKAMKLKKMIRVKNGIAIPGRKKSDAAVYDPKTETITLGEATFESDADTLGEGTFVHELGHALWAAMPLKMRSNYCSLSWDYNKILGEWVSQRDSTEFITSYSSTSCSEDFAEHFSAYVHQSELLSMKSPTKQKWIHQNVFPQVEYFNTAHRSALLDVDSKCPDTQSPEFLGSLQDNLKFVCNAIEHNQAEIIVEMTNLKDNLSGVKDIYLRFVDDADNDCVIFMGEQSCIDPKTGTYQRRTVIDLARYRPHTLMKPHHFTITDRAGNTLTPPISNLPSFVIPGKLVGGKPEKPKVFDDPKLESKIKIETLPSEPSQIWVHLPFTRDDLKLARNPLRLSFKTEPQTFTFFWDEEVKDIQYSESGYAKIKINLEVVPQGDYVLDRIDITNENTEKNDSQTFNKNLNTASPTLHFHHNGYLLSKPKINLQDLAFTSEEKENRNGGAVTLKIKFRASEFKQGTHNAKVNIRSPDGKIFTAQFRVSPQKAGAEEEITAILDLPPNHAKGTYIIQDISYEQDIPVWGQLLVLGLGKETIKLLERGITKTIEIQGNPGLNTNVKTPQQ